MSISTPFFRGRVLAIATTFALLTGALALGGTAATASADDATVMNSDDLNSAIGSGQTSGAIVTLGGDISTGQISVQQTLTIDLAGYELDTSGIDTSSGITLTIEDTSGDNGGTSTGKLTDVSSS